MTEPEGFVKYTIAISFTANTYRRQTFLTNPNVCSALPEAIGTLGLTHPFANELARTRVLRSLKHVLCDI